MVSNSSVQLSRCIELLGYVENTYRKLLVSNEYANSQCWYMHCSDNSWPALSVRRNYLSLSLDYDIIIVFTQFNYK